MKQTPISENQIQQSMKQTPISEKQIKQNATQTHPPANQIQQNMKQIPPLTNQIQQNMKQIPTSEKQIQQNVTQIPHQEILMQNKRKNLIDSNENMLTKQKENNDSTNKNYNLNISIINEMQMKLGELNNLSFREYKYITKDILLSISKLKDKYCVFPLFYGEKIFIFIKEDKFFLVFENNIIKEIKVKFKCQINAILEGCILKNTIQINDILLLNNVCTKKMKFNQRITLIYKYIVQNQEKNDIHLNVTPFYKVSDFKQLSMKEFQNIKGWCFSEPDQSKNIYYSWEYKPENPIAILHLNFLDNCAYGQFTDSFKLIDFVSLGKITPELFELNGSLIEIMITKSKDNNFQGKFVKTSKQLSPWSVIQFKNRYLYENDVKVEDIINAFSQI